MQIALVLGGGGVRGFAHIGVLDVLDQEGFEVKALAGSSIGGLIGASYALGKSPASINDYVSRIDQSALFRPSSGQKSGFEGVEGVKAAIKDVYGTATFEDLIIPFAANAVDICTGEPIIIDKGPILEAVMATIALPGIFPPGKWDGRAVYDGGVINSNPIGLARALAPRLPVVAVILSRPLPAWPRPSPLDRVIKRPLLLKLIKRTRYYRSFDNFVRSFEILNHTYSKLLLDLDPPEVEIRPNTHHIETLAQVDIDEVVGLGAEAARKALPELASLDS